MMTPDIHSPTNTPAATVLLAHKLKGTQVLEESAREPLTPPQDTATPPMRDLVKHNVLMDRNVMGLSTSPSCEASGLAAVHTSPLVHLDVAVDVLDKAEGGQEGHGAQCKEEHIAGEDGPAHKLNGL